MASKGPRAPRKAATPPVADVVDTSVAVAPEPTSTVQVPFAEPQQDAETTTRELIEAAAETAPVAADPIIEAAETVTTHAAEQAETVVKETKTMATQFDTTTPNQMFTGFNDRAKAAMEKSGKMVEEMNEFGKGNVEALVESSRIALKGFESIGQDAAEYGRKSFEGFTAAMKSMASVKSPTELFKLHSDFVKASFDQAVAEASKNTEAMIKLAGDAAQPISNRFAVAADKAKSIA
jgi:phasin family protein